MPIHITLFIKRDKTLCNTLNWWNWNSEFKKLVVRWADICRQFDIYYVQNLDVFTTDFSYVKINYLVKKNHQNCLIFVGEFTTYGTDVLAMTELNQEEREDPMARVIFYEIKKKKIVIIFVKKICQKNHQKNFVIVFVKKNCQKNLSKKLSKNSSITSM